jgi:hypothetical protein
VEHSNDAAQEPYGPFVSAITLRNSLMYNERMALGTTLRELGAKNKLSAERVRQIIGKIDRRKANFERETRLDLYYPTRDEWTWVNGRHWKRSSMPGRPFPAGGIFPFVKYRPGFQTT